MGHQASLFDVDSQPGNRLRCLGDTLHLLPLLLEGPCGRMPPARAWTQTSSPLHSGVQPWLSALLAGKCAQSYLLSHGLLVGSCTSNFQTFFLVLWMSLSCAVSSLWGMQALARDEGCAASCALRARRLPLPSLLVTPYPACLRTPSCPLPLHRRHRRAQRWSQGLHRGHLTPCWEYEGTPPRQGRQLFSLWPLRLPLLPPGGQRPGDRPGVRRGILTPRQ